MSTLDTLVLGGGPNGLIAATYLARGGRKVLLLEPGSQTGGSAVTDTFADGFRVSATFPSAETFEPSILSELGIADAVEILPPEGFLVASASGEPLVLPPSEDGSATAEAIARQASGDADAFRDLDRFLRRIADALHPLVANPLPPLEPEGLGDLFGLAKHGLRLRGLGAHDLAEFMRFLPMPIHDVVEERFADERLRAAVAGPALVGSWCGPRSPGSTLNMVFHRLGLGRGAVAFPRFVRGGIGQLSAALETAARQAGVEIRTDASIQRIRTEDGRVRGVLLDGGEALDAGTVVSTLDPRRTLVDLVDPLAFEPHFRWQARNIRCRGIVGLVHYALSNVPDFQGVDDTAPLRGRIQVGETVDALEQAFDATKYGEIPERPYLDVTIPSLTDPSLAPDGQHVLSAWVQFPPYHLRDRTWDDARDAFGDIVDQRLESVAPGFTGQVLHRRVLTPKDLEDRFGVTGGCLHHVEPALDQALYMRPYPGGGRHDTPIQGLWLGGQGTHGGPGLTGLPGRNVARRVLDSRVSNG